MLLMMMTTRMLKLTIMLYQKTVEREMPPTMLGWKDLLEEVMEMISMIASQEVARVEMLWTIRHIWMPTQVVVVQLVVVWAAAVILVHFMTIGGQWVAMKQTILLQNKVHFLKPSNKI